jgi:hypothetical protein
MNVLRISTAILIYLTSLTASAEEFRVLDLAPYSIQSDTPWMQVITDREQWLNFYYARLLGCPTVYPTAIPPETDPCALPEPLIDFETQQVVVGGLGAKPSTAYSLLISGVSISEDGQEVIQVIDYERCLGLTVIDYPMAAVVVSNTGLPIRVNVVEAREKCEESTPN